MDIASKQDIYNNHYNGDQNKSSSEQTHKDDINKKTDDKPWTHPDAIHNVLSSYKYILKIQIYNIQ